MWTLACTCCCELAITLGDVLLDLELARTLAVVAILGSVGLLDTNLVLIPEQGVRIIALVRCLWCRFELHSLI